MLTAMDDFSRGATWGKDDTIVYATADSGTGLYRVAGVGGEPTVLTTPDPKRGEGDHLWPEFLPGGEAVLFTIRAVDGGLANAQIAVLDLGTGIYQTVLRGGHHAHYLPTGHLVYGASGALRAVPFDVGRFAVTGSSVPILDGLATMAGGGIDLAVAATGTLVYVPGSVGGAQRSLVWVDREGREEPLAAPPRNYVYPRLSPDGTRVALDVRGPEDDIWIWDLVRETLTRLTIDPGADRYPVWTPDGTRVVFTSNANAAVNLYWKAADGTGTVDRLTESTNFQAGHSFSPDGESLVLRETQPDTGSDLRVLSLAGDRGVETLLATEFDEWSAGLSPDGRWIAYQSNQSGQFEVYVRPFPNVDDGQWQISTSGGTRPLWASDGRELFYRRGNALMTVPVQTEPSFTPATPEILFKGAYYTGADRSYDVASDGQRFLMIKGGGLFPS